MVGQRSEDDWTERMNAYAPGGSTSLAQGGAVRLRAEEGLAQLRPRAREGLPVRRSRSAAPERDGQGLFAAVLVRAFPHLPIEEEGRLNDAQLRENFIERMFAYHRLQALWATRWTLRSLIEFHTAHKMALLAHDEPGYRRLGRLVATARRSLAPSCASGTRPAS